MPDPSHDAAPGELSTVLWKERQLLDLLLFKLEEEQLLVTAGRTRWLAHATREVELVVDKLRHAELARAGRVEVLAAAMGLPPAPTLRAIAEAVEPPWDDIFAGHRQAFLEVTTEISRVADVTCALAGSQRDSARRAIGWLVGQPAAGPSAYDASGVARRDHAGHLLINETL